MVLSSEQVKENQPMASFFGKILVVVVAINYIYVSMLSGKLDVRAWKLDLEVGK
jgi:hypothetical protein